MVWTEPEDVVAKYAIVTTGSPSALVRAAFPGFEIKAVPQGRIQMIGSVRDEAELHGVLHRLQDLGLRLVDAHLIEDD